VPDQIAMRFSPGGSSSILTTCCSASFQYSPSAGSYLDLLMLVGKAPAEGRQPRGRRLDVLDFGLSDTHEAEGDPGRHVPHEVSYQDWLGATAFLIFETPMAEVGSPRNTMIGHTVGVATGAPSLLLFGLWNSPSVYVTGMTAPRIGAVALAVALTGGVLRVLRSAHPPAGATTIIVASGLLARPHQLLDLLVGVLLLTAAGWSLNRLFGVPGPLWGASREPGLRARIGSAPRSSTIEVARVRARHPARGTARDQARRAPSTVWNQDNDLVLAHPHAGRPLDHDHGGLSQGQPPYLQE